MMSDSRVYIMNPKYIKKTIRKVVLSIYQYYRVCIYKYNKSNGTKHYQKKKSRSVLFSLIWWSEYGGLGKLYYNADKCIVDPREQGP